MTRIEAANARTAEADAAFAAQDYAAAARDYTLAAEQLEAIWHEMHGGKGHSQSPDAQNARRQAREAIQHRNEAEAREAGRSAYMAGRPVIWIHGRPFADPAHEADQ